MERPTPALDAGIARGLADVEAVLQGMLHSHDPVMAAMAKEVVGAGGKRLRPRLMLLAHAACTAPPLGDKGRRANGAPASEGPRPMAPALAPAREAGEVASAPLSLVEAAAGVELIHAASLVHDDVIDKAAMRRGAPATQAQHGAHQAIIAGDFLFIQGFALAGRQDAQVVALTAQACRSLAEGELLELRTAQEGGLDLPTYLRIVEGKTASLLEGAARIGAHLADRDDLQEALGLYGRHLGIAFQVSDDLLDLRGDPAVTGKPRGTDLRNRAPNAGVLLAARNGARARLARFLAAQGNGDDEASPPTEDEVQEALEAVLRSGALREAERLAAHHGDLAVAALAPLPPSAAKQALVDLVHRLPGRAR